MIVLRDITEHSELKAVEELQTQIWGCSEREIFPSLALIPIIEIGGVLIGAFDENDLVGFVLGFPGIEDGKLILHSDMLGVKPQYRSHRLGYRLKLAQREKALQNGIDKITWTFDPLQSLNAHLNFSRLGVISDCYKVNYYGQTSSFLHSTGTDRLWVSWLLNSDRVKRRVDAAESSQEESREVELEHFPTLLRVSDADEPLLNNEALLSNAHLRGAVALEIPGNISELMSEKTELAVRWRAASREAFTRILNVGYTVTEFYRSERKGRFVGCYLATTIGDDTG